MSALEKNGSRLSQAPQRLPTKHKLPSVPVKSQQDSSSSTKPRTTAKTAAREDAPASPKPKARSLYSFFNTATQLQQSKRSQSPEKATVKSQEEDLIDDDSLDEASIQASGVFTERNGASQLGKRPAQAMEAFDAIDAERLSFGSQKFLKFSTGAKVERPNVQHPNGDNLNTTPWIERFAPTTLDELAVHKRKVNDVQRWLNEAFEARQGKKLLVLKGSAGTGKTMTLRLLSSTLGFQIHEWRNPVGSVSSPEGYVSVMTLFEDFLARTTTYGSLSFGDEGTAHPAETYKKSGDLHDGKQIILVEEFPFSLGGTSTTLQSFRAIMQQHLASFSDQSDSARTSAILVMVISETLVSTTTAPGESFTAYQILGSEILTHPAVTVIEFNPIAPTILTKALDLVILKEARKSGRRKAPGPQVIKRLSEIGDVRSAVSSLEFFCVRGDECDGWGTKIAFKKPKGATKDLPLTRMELDSLEAMSQRENSLGIFHSVGKVIYNKREATSGSERAVPQPPTYFPQHRRPTVPEVNVEKLINELGTDTDTFLAALHENYILSCAGSTSEDTSDSVNGCIDALSDADLVSSTPFSRSGFRGSFQRNSADSLRQDEMSFHVGVQGVLFSLPSPVRRIAVPEGITQGQGRGKKTDAYKIFYPNSLRIRRQQEEIEGMLDAWVQRAETGGLTSASFTHAQTEGPKPGSVESWSKPSHSAVAISSGADDSSPGHDVEEHPRSLLGGGSSARREMLLERLPYMALIIRSHGITNFAAQWREIAKITSFTGSCRLSDDVPDELESAMPLDKERHITTNSNNKLEGFEGNGSQDILGERTVQALVLSDDDIVDDEIP